MSMNKQACPPIRIMLGSGGVKQIGFISTEWTTLNVLKEETFLSYSSPNVVDCFFAEHVWEHLSLVEGEIAARNCFKFLRPGGTLRIAVPDGLHPDPGYLEWVRPGGTGLGASGHRVLFTWPLLRDLLTHSSFTTVVPLEWWDERGRFHFSPWGAENGFVRRSCDNDHRNKKTPLSYTSLIVDAIKDE